MIIHGTSDPGHVAIVDHINGNKLYAVEQNVATSGESSPGWATYTITNGVLSRDQSIGLAIRGVVHSPKNPNTNGSTSTGGYQVAFQGEHGNLITVGTAGGTNWQQGMMSGTSPQHHRPLQWRLRDGVPGQHGGPDYGRNRRRHELASGNDARHEPEHRSAANGGFAGSFPGEHWKALERRV